MDIMSEKGWMQILINPFYIFIIMLLLIGLEWILVKKTKFYLTKKEISILIYTSTFLGIFSIVYDNRNNILKFDEHTLKEQLKIDFQRDFLNRVEWLDSCYSIPFVKSDCSPTNFNELQQDKRAFHEWISVHKEYISSSIFNLKHIEITNLEYPYYPNSELAYKDDLNYFKYNITKYNSMLSKLDKIWEQANYGDDNVFSFLYPLLFIFALSLQITKEFFMESK